MRSILARAAVLLACVIAGASLHASSADAVPVAKTHRAVVRPVTSAGEPASGWSVKRLKGRATCWGTSPSAVVGGIATCSPSALYLPSCWKSTGQTVLCLQDPAGRALVRVRYTGTYPQTAAPARPQPQGLVLGDGEHCRLRVGGAWGSVPGHPHWVGFYSCDGGDVYGSPRGGGIDRSAPVWQVHLVDEDNDLLTRRVRSVTYVATAAGPGVTA